MLSLTWFTFYLLIGMKKCNSALEIESFGSCCIDTSHVYSYYNNVRRASIMVFIPTKA